MKKQKNNFSEIGSIVINFLRPDITIKCLDTLTQYAPGIKIYVGDQDDNNEKLKEYCQKNNINYIKLPFDCGIGVARNTLIKEAKSDNCKYIMWGDNDFVYDEKLRLQNALKVLKHDKSVGIVGGTVLKNNIVQHYERIIYYNKFYQTACFIPLEYTYPETHYADKVDYYYCDMTFNFCVARINIFNDNVKWDEGIKVKFEHSYFFCQYLKYSKYKVAYCPSIMVNHEHGRDEKYHKYRYRVNDGKIYAEKLKMKTGFAVNDKSWNHVTQDFMDFRKVASESPTFISALKYNSKQKKDLSEKKLREIARKQFNHIFDLFDYLDEKHLQYVILKKTCLEAVKKKQINYDEKSIWIGVDNPDSIYSFFLNEGFTQEGKNKFIFNDYNIYVEYYHGQTKQFDIGSRVFIVPYPVIQYLKKTYGNKWEKTDG